jgi:hypothetical protein
MQRSVVLAMVAGLLVAVGALAAAVAVPRYDCPEGLILIAEPERRHTDNDFTCVPVAQSDEGTSWAYQVSDRLWIKIGMATVGVILGGGLALLAFTRHRGQRSAASVEGIREGG